jgi:4-amino-4-deoxy-L-arabinose transferase-like glycosyltransferase
MTGSKTSLSVVHWSWVIGLLLLAWGLRLLCLEAVPPGWRDDELINIHALSGELLAGRFSLYYTGASGHEPLYHHLHAGVHAILGFNVLSGHLLSVALGTLSIALTYTLTRRLFGHAAAVIASLMLTTSFWSLMYSRTAIRHISLPPFALATLYLLWRAFSSKSGANGATTTWFLTGLVAGLSLYTYPAARLLLVSPILFAAYLALFHRKRFRRCWRGLLLSLVIAGALAVPLIIAIAQGRSDAAAQGIGADARLAELAVPLRELQAGNPRPLLESTWTTLRMFHATGDPEWLYNIPNRPVFNLLGGALLWVGAALCACRWRRPRYFYLLLWLGLGVFPAFVSTPPASLSHTILAQPVAYILPALALAEVKPQMPNVTHRIGPRILSIGYWILVISVLATNAARDLHDYFVTWPQRGMVRFLYRTDYRDAARYLEAHPEITDVAISSDLMGPWNRLALEVDTRREDVAVRLFNPERALLWFEGDAPSTVLLTSFPRPSSLIDEYLEANAGPPETIPPHLERRALSPISDPQSPVSRPSARFANGLELIGVRTVDHASLSPGQEVTVLATWLVAAPLDLPDLPVVANPPPPGVYSGPRLAVFAHLIAADGTLPAGDDGLWVDPLTLRPGDRFVQVHRLTLPPDAPAGPYTVALGLYDPLTGDRWPTLQADGQPGPESLLIPIEEEP